MYNPVKKQNETKQDGAGNAKQTGLFLHVAFTLDTDSTSVSFSFNITSHGFFFFLFTDSYFQHKIFQKFYYLPLETPPPLNYLNITKFRGVEILPSRNSSHPCKYVYIFPASQLENFSRSKVLLLYSKFPKISKVVSLGNRRS